MARAKLYTAQEVEAMLQSLTVQWEPKMASDAIEAFVEHTMAPYHGAGLTLGEAGERVLALSDAAPEGSGFDGMREMYRAAGLDPVEAWEAISGIATSVPAPLTKEQHEALMTGLTIALLAGHEAASGEATR